jgi:CHC2 zinc finger
VDTGYHSTNTKQDVSQPERRYRGVSYVKPITAAKEAVSVLDLADMLCGPGRLRQVGDRWTARCPLPDHEDKIPSFVAYPETNSWYCFSCLRGGDVVELARLAWGYDQRQSHTAAAMLLMEFGYEPPQRPPAYFRKQERQRPVRDAIDHARLEHLQRRLFRRFFKASVLAIEDEEEREAEYQALWNEAGRLAKLLRDGLEARRTA